MRRSSLIIILNLLLVFIGSGCGAATPAATPSPSPIPASTSIPTITPTVLPTATSIPKILLPVRGVIGPFERRGYPSGYYEGQILNEFNNYDQYAGSTVAEEIGVQLEAMRSLGINTIWLTLSAADAQPGNFIPPACTVNPDLGPLFPRPTETELANLKALFDLIHSKGIQVVLNLSNTHMEDRLNSEIWLKSILEVVKDHPALYLVLFSGDIHVHHYDTAGIADTCGGRAEPNLWEGPGAGSVQYLKWALPFANSLGIPYRKLSAEAILGFYASVAHTPNQFMTDGHYWDPEVVLKGIFDDLGIPNEQRTYAISFYEHHKCFGMREINIPCEDEAQQPWAIETMERLFAVIGRNNGARVVAVETGYYSPSETDWNSELAWESLIWLYQAYGIEGCEFWLWTYSENANDLDPSLTPAVKLRGPDFTYNSVKDILQQLYTQGQTDDLKLTPDTIAPVFTSISATPTAVQNGDRLTFSARLGETHLFVWVEMSSLDSDKTSQVVLLDQGDGTYQREVSLSLWNIQANGIKNLKVTAMDFWSNVTTTSLDVELKNPLPILDITPPNDDFTGTVLDPGKWKPDLAGGATVLQDGKVILSTSSHEKYSAGTIYSNWQFPGDFDVQIDFELGQGWGAPAEDHLDGAIFGVEIGGQRYWVTRLLGGSGDSVFSMNSIDQIIGQRYTEAVSGKYRLIRQGTKLNILFDIGTGWQRIVSKTVATDSAQIYFGNGSINASQAFTTYFDNFVINSGLTTYKP
jgi:hypothetical protein